MHSINHDPEKLLLKFSSPPGRAAAASTATAACYDHDEGISGANEATDGEISRGVTRGPSENCSSWEPSAL